jgi:hypothetical protein
MMRMIAPGSLKMVTRAIVQMLRGMLMLINEPKRLMVKMMMSAIKRDLKNHFKKLFTNITH